MRLVTFRGGMGERLGALVETDVLDLARLGEREGGDAVPASMLTFIQAGPAAWARARDLVARYKSAGGPPADVVRHVSEVRLIAPIPRPTKNVFCLGFNYRAHLEEAYGAQGRPARDLEVPVFFSKAVTAVIGPEDPIPFDETVSTQYDWEAELGVVIGIGGRSIPEDRAMEHVFGYTCFNDVSVRDLQSAYGQWFKGKSVDGTCPFGPAIVTADEVPDPHCLSIECRVNGVVKQQANTASMIFGVPPIIAHLSRGLTLEPGDLISTGTPSGVGYARTPPEFLKPGDVVEVEVAGVGLLRNRVEEYRER